MFSMFKMMPFVLVVDLLAGSASAQEPAPTALAPPPAIVTSGEAIVRRTPDQAFVTVSVDSRARNPRDAQRQNAEAMAAVQQRVAGCRD